mmetsp:Transcript_6136/g.5068  ORF Transcript_6136/g.5068 Transcript_6136/m.5068 type:complete len:118 (+) Transcript_6136:53-406(+)
MTSSPLSNTSPRIRTSFSRLDFEVFGKVQGVFFRRDAAREAERLGLHGWCMNTPRGTVEGCIEGPAKIVDEMVYWLGNVGSKRARIDRLEVKDRNEISVDDRQFTSFVVSHPTITSL